MTSYPTFFHHVKDMKKNMNVTMYDNFLCKWGSGVAHDTYMSNNYHIYNFELKEKEKKAWCR